MRSAGMRGVNKGSGECMIHEHHFHNDAPFAGVGPVALADSRSRSYLEAFVAYVAA